MLKERERNKIADYADCIDDDISIIDDDDTVYEVGDELTFEENEAYRNECEVMKFFKAELRRIVGFCDRDLWANPLNKWD